MRSGNLLTIDHSASPGLTEEIARRFGLPTEVAGEGRKLEVCTRTCCGCQQQVMLRTDRSSPRNYCRKCDSYMCDDCALVLKTTGVHKSFAQVADEYLEKAANGLLIFGED